ncbi:HET-domain-containing protein, partial [Cryphonectria parasitica EP155]
MNRWISVCRSEHGKCSAWSSSHEGERHMPARVLDVANDAIRLYLPEDSARDEYIALSYCWGSGNPYKTTTSNIEEHLKEISISALPLSLQDVVRLTRKVGFRYLWIDALCIIQDDYDDWLREASKMKAVYSQAFLTISTDMLADTTALFLDVHRNLERMCRPSSSEEPENIYVVPTFRTFGDQIKMSPLAKRGWTFQERALSSRILHIGQESNYWECKE